MSGHVINFSRAHPGGPGRPEGSAPAQVRQLPGIGVLPQKQGPLRAQLLPQRHGQGRRSRDCGRLHGFAGPVAGGHPQRRGRLRHRPHQGPRANPLALRPQGVPVPGRGRARAARPCAAAWAKSLLAQGLEVKVPVLPAEEDPDSFARKFGGEKIKELFGQSDTSSASCCVRRPSRWTR